MDDPPGSIGESVNMRRVSHVTMDNVDIDGFTQSRVLVNFFDESPSPVRSTVTWEDSCRIEVTEPAPDESSVVREFHDLGTLRVSGGLRDVVLESFGEGYRTYASDQRLWRGGESLRVSLRDESGDDSEAPVLATEIAAPEPLFITNPLYPLDNHLMISRYHHVEVSWDGVSSGELVMLLSKVNREGEPGVAVECSFPASDGFGRISPWVFQVIPEDASIKLSAKVVSRKTVVLPLWGNVDIAASSPVLTPSGVQYAAELGFWPPLEF